jgi:hypothetical protein
MGALEEQALMCCTACVRNEVTHIVCSLLAFSPCCQICLCTECAWRKIQRPDYLCSWVDLKQQFGATYKQHGNLRTCVEAAGEMMPGVRHVRPA